MMSNSNIKHSLTTSKARSHCVLWPAQFCRKLVLGTRSKWPRPRRNRDVDNFSPEETETRRWYVSKPRRRDQDPTLVYGLFNRKFVVFLYIQATLYGAPERTSRIFSLYVRT